MTAVIDLVNEPKEHWYLPPADLSDKVKSAAKGAVNKTYDTWMKMPRVLRYIIGTIGIACGIYAWCIGVAYLVFGLAAALGVTSELGWIITLVLYYGVAVGVPIGIMVSYDDVL